MSDGTGGGWLQGLPPDVRRTVRAAMSEATVKDGTVIFDQGEASEALYEVINGQVVISHISMDGEEAIVTVFGPGDCLGEQGLIDGGVRANSARAHGETRLRRLLKADFIELRSQFPVITDHLLQLISLRFRLALMLLDEAATAPLRTRLLRRLLLLANTYGSHNSERSEIAISLSQSDLGKWVGYSRQSVNAEIQSLKNEGLISWIDGVLTVTNLDAIKKELDTDDLLTLGRADDKEPLTD